MRVHELAKAVDLESKEILAIAKRHRIPVKASASATLDDKEVRKLYPHIEKYKTDLKEKAAKERKAKEEERLRKEEERRKKEEERRRLAEEKRKSEEEERQRHEEEARLAAERKAAEERRKQEELEAQRREQEAKQRAAAAPQAPPPPQPRAAAQPGTATPRPAPHPGAPAPRTGMHPGTGQPRPPQQGGAPPRRDGRPYPGGGQVRRDGRPGAPPGAGGQPPRRDGRPGGPPFTGGQPPRRDGRPPGRPLRPGEKPLRRDGQPDKPVELTKENLPQMGAKLDDPRRRGGEAKRGPVTPSKGKDRRKPKPSRIFELDEDMTVTSRPGKGVGGGKPGGQPQQRYGRRPHRPKRQGGYSGGSSPAVMDRQKAVTVRGTVTVGQFADKIGIGSNEVMKKLLLLGEMLTLNQNISAELMELLGADFGVELEIIHEGDEHDVAKYIVKDNPENLKRRPPVVTIMGHVDHGKTSLLDFIRKSNVVDDEFGGITQHIGAYHVTTSKGDIVFLDTPGHEAFTSMRARGASVTDLVILVVASNDGFMPQTIEAIHHSQAAKVPLVVAVNKVDLPSADPAKVRQEALQHGLVSEEFGGDTIFVDISAKKGTNVEQLLEMVALQAEILDLNADPERRAEGTIIESHIDPQRGAVATVLVQKGTLHVNDYFVCGDVSGRVRAMNDDHGRPVQAAGPSFPAEILGLNDSPSAGEPFLVVENEQIAREVAETREERRRTLGLAPTTQKHVTLEGLHEILAEGRTKELNIILKGDVQGSIEAVSQSLAKLSTEKVRIKVLHSGVGGINESDVNLAIASDAVIIGFNVRPEVGAGDLAEQEGVDIKLYRIIYDLVEEVKAAMVGMLDPKFREKVMGHAEVRQTFKISRLGTIAGCSVRDGEISRDSKVRVVRDNIVVYEGTLASLRRVKDDVKKVTQGLECGIGVENFNDIKEGDIIEAYTMEQVAQTLDSAD